MASYRASFFDNSVCCYLIRIVDEKTPYFVIMWVLFNSVGCCSDCAVQRFHLHDLDYPIFTCVLLTLFRCVSKIESFRMLKLDGNEICEEGVSKITSILLKSGKILGGTLCFLCNQFPLIFPTFKTPLLCTY